MNILSNFYIELLHEESKMPMRSTKGSAGYDIFANKDIVLPKGTITKIPLPFCFKGDLEQSVVARVFVRSSFGIKKKIRLVEDGHKNIEGITLVISSPVHEINMLNDSDTDVTILKDEHFAQIVFSTTDFNYQPVVIEQVDEKERVKNPPIPCTVKEVQPFVYDYILEETVTLAPQEQKTFPTGLKAKVEEGTWLAIGIHPDVKETIMLANQMVVGDLDYYSNKGNDGNYHLAILNLTDKVVTLPAGTHVACWWSEKFYTLEKEVESVNERIGGIGSTNQ